MRNENNKSILIISTDEIFIKKTKEDKKSMNSDITYFTEDRFYFISESLDSFDLIVFDNREQQNRNQDNFVRFMDIYKITQNNVLKTPIIILDTSVSKNIPYSNNSNIYSLLTMPITNDILFTNISACLSYLDSNCK